MNKKQIEEMEQQFEVLWLEMMDYAEDIGYPVEYVEDEFFLEGEFIKVRLDDVKFGKM